MKINGGIKESGKGNVRKVNLKRERRGEEKGRKV